MFKSSDSVQKLSHVKYSNIHTKILGSSFGMPTTKGRKPRLQHSCAHQKKQYPTRESLKAIVDIVEQDLEVTEKLLLTAKPFLFTCSRDMIIQSIKRS